MTEEHEEDPFAAVSMLSAALVERNIAMMDGPVVGMLDDVKVRFTPEGAIHLASLLTCMADAYALVASWTDNTEDRQALGELLDVLGLDITETT